MGTLDLLFGGGVFCFVLFLAVLFPCCFVSIVLVLVVFSIVKLFVYELCFILVLHASVSSV